MTYDNLRIYAKFRDDLTKIFKIKLWQKLRQPLPCLMSTSADNNCCIFFIKFIVLLKITFLKSKQCLHSTRLVATSYFRLRQKGKTVPFCIVATFPQSKFHFGESVSDVCLTLYFCKNGCSLVLFRLANAF